jgi:hypothetical protein
MLTGGGAIFTELLHDLVSSLWHHEIQLKTWELSLLQQIYKRGNKLKTDPASYRGIYLSSALAKLFEGILLHRLTQYTKAHDTLTPNLISWAHGQADRYMTQSTHSLPSSSITGQKQNPQHKWRSWITLQLTRTFTEAASQHSYTNSIPWGKCGINCAPALAR